VRSNIDRGARGGRSRAVLFVLVCLLGSILPSSIVEAATAPQRPSPEQPSQAGACPARLFSAVAPQATGAPCVKLQSAAPLLPSGFQESIVWSNLTNPTAVRFAADGRVFVAEKSGLIKIFTGLTDPTPDVFSDLTTNVQNYWDRGLLGLALDPSLTGGPGPVRPWIYVLYSYDHILGSSAAAPQWGDTCPTPPGPTTDGCVASARLSRFTVNGTTISGPEQVLIEDWCQQFPSHSIGTVAFGPDGALYVGGGDGASFTVVDHGQLGGTLSGTPTPINPCGDPPGGTMSPPDAAGGSLRAQDSRTGTTSPAYNSLIAADGAVAYWRLGESSGTTVTDSRGTNTGTYVGAPQMGVAGALNGDPNTAVTFPAASAYASIPDANALDFGNGPFTVEFWYKASTPNTLRFLLSKGSQFNVYMNGTGNLTVDNDNTAAVQVGPGMGIGADTTNWHHYAITRAGSGPTGMKIYQDGVDVTNFASDQTFSSNSMPLSIGRYYDGSFPALGTLDEVALYNKVLTSAQINSHYAAAYPATSSSDPTGLDGAILRLDPVTGAAMPDNPMASSSDPNQRRIIAYGMRNPFRFTLRPGTNELWVGDVGAGTYEEVNRIANISDGVVENFGWPCYEGAPRNTGFDDLNVTLCENLYAAGPSAVTPPVFAYDHQVQVISGETCPVGSSAIAGMAFYPETGGTFPAFYRGGLFFADHNRSCIWFMPKGANGQPDPTQRVAFAPGAANPVDLQIGPNGDLFYVDFDTSSVRRITAVGGANQPPTARIIATPPAGPVPLSVAFDGRTSSDPESGALTYRWDLDGDGTYDDSTLAAPIWQYTTPGPVTVGLEVTDPGNLKGTTTTIVTPGGATNTPPVPVIATPVVGTTWGVGDPDPLAFSGSATDAQDGTLAPANLTWTLVLQHCPSNCHTHTIESFPGVASGTFFPPDHDYPSYLELTLTATDSAGLSASVTRRLDPRTANLSFATVPTGLQLTVSGTGSTAPFSRTVIDGSKTSLSAPTPQDLSGLRYGFTSWSDGGAASHDITARTGQTYTATYAPVSTDIKVTKTFTRASKKITYTITVAYVKGVTAQAVVMTDTLVSRLTYVSSTTNRGTCTRAGQKVTCSIGTLGSGQTATIKIVANVNKLTGSVANTAAVTTSSLDLVTTNNSSTATVSF
jgi:uncharacterized repeat protein (TIGR01451 family)